MLVELLLSPETTLMATVSPDRRHTDRTSTGTDFPRYTRPRNCQLLGNLDFVLVYHSEMQQSAVKPYLRHEDHGFPSLSGQSRLCADYGAPVRPSKLNYLMDFNSMY